MNVTLTATTWMTGFTAGATTSSPLPGNPGEYRDGFQYGRAHKLGDTHGAELIRPFDGHDGEFDSTALLAALGETGSFTPENADQLITLVNAYTIAWEIRSRP